MNRSLLILLLLAGCGRGDRTADNAAAPAVEGKGRSSSAAPGRAVERPLAGLYEGPEGTPRSQMCIVEKGGKAQFGLVVWGANLHSCSGAGEAIRKGEHLTLTMEGDETCAIPASLQGGTVTLPARLPAGCAYYCGERASFAGARLTRTGENTKAAKDVAGDPLCD